MGKNYVKAEAWNRRNIQDALWYAMDDTDRSALLANENVAFGDKCYVITTKKTYILGNDNTWYEM